LAFTALGVRPALADVSLASTAHELGYTYRYTGVQDAVQLSRPGVVVTIRPGENLFDVNEHTETTPFAPRVSHNEVYISDELAAQLRMIATRFPLLKQGYAAPAPVNAHPTSGTIALNDVRQVAGTFDLLIEGDAPPGAPITLTEKATFATEIPDTMLRVINTKSDANGHFTATVPASPGAFRGAIITIIASSVSGITDASTKLVLTEPNHGVSVPAEQEPKSVQ
jgi:hypothetical protein